MVLDYHILPIVCFSCDAQDDRGPWFEKGEARRKNRSNVSMQSFLTSSSFYFRGTRTWLTLQDPTGIGPWGGPPADNGVSVPPCQWLEAEKFSAAKVKGGFYKDKAEGFIPRSSSPWEASALHLVKNSDGF
jgi:hypothetical protein